MLIPITLRGSVVVQAKVDDDQAHLAQFKWNLICGRYAVRSTCERGRKVSVYMHREILGLEPGNPLEADHLNHDGLDNQRHNLEAVTHAENMRRRRAFRFGNQWVDSLPTGVSLSCDGDRWIASNISDRTFPSKRAARDACRKAVARTAA